MNYPSCTREQQKQLDAMAHRWLGKQWLDCTLDELRHALDLEHIDAALNQVYIDHLKAGGRRL